MLTIATVGTSDIAARFVAATDAVPGISVRTAYSRDETRARTFAGRHRIERSAFRPQALWSDSALDAVYIATPNATHLRWAEEAIAAGKHVLIEKPAAASAAQFRALVAAAADHGVVVLEAMRSVYEPGFRLIADLLPALGSVRRVSFGLSQRSARYDRVLAGEAPAIFDPALAGGALRDIGVYPLAALVHLFGAPDHVAGRTVPVATGADGAGAAILGYPTFIADISFSKITASDRPSQIEGEEGTMLIDRIDRPSTITVRSLAGERVVRTSELDPHELSSVIRRFVDVVRGGGDASVDHARTVTTLAIVDHLLAEA